MGQYLKTSAEIYHIIGTFLNRLAEDPHVVAAMQALNTSIRFVVTNPQAELTINVHGVPGNYIICGPSNVEAGIVLRADADVGHQIWTNEIPLMKAAVSGQLIIERGSIPTLMKFLPILKPALELYPQVLRDLGRSDLLPRTG